MSPERLAFVMLIVFGGSISYKPVVPADITTESYYGSPFALFLVSYGDKVFSLLLL
jgi:hypothetical protein